VAYPASCTIDSRSFSRD